MANTLDAALVPDTVADRVVTTLGKKLATLGIFASDFSSDLMDPKRPFAIPIVTDGSTTLINATDFQSGDGSTITTSLVTPKQITQTFEITNAEKQIGHKLERLVKKNAQKFGEAIMREALAPLDAATYTNTPIVAATAVDLDTGDLQDLWGSLSDTDEKALILNGAYYAKQIPQNNDDFTLADGYMGFDAVRMNNEIGGAEAGTVGFAAGPDALAFAARVPSHSSSVSSSMISEQVVTLPDLGIAVLITNWVDTQTRTEYMAFDVCFGSIEADVAALTLIQTS